MPYTSTACTCAPSVGLRGDAIVAAVYSGSRTPIAATPADVSERQWTETNMRATEMGRETYLTVQDVADQLNVHPDTVRKWIRSGELTAIPLGGTAGYRITQGAVDKFIQERINRVQDDNK